MGKDRFRDKEEPAVDVWWVDAIRKPGSYSAVPNAVLWCRELTPGERVTYAALVRFGGLQACQSGDWCTVGTAALSALTAMSRRGVQRALRGLEAKGLLAADRTSGGRGRGAANSYRLRYVVGPKGHVLDRGNQVRTECAARGAQSARVVRTNDALSKAVSANRVRKSESVNCISDGVSPAASLLATQQGERPKEDAHASGDSVSVDGLPLKEKKPDGPTGVLQFSAETGEVFQELVQDGGICYRIVKPGAAEYAALLPEAQRQQAVKDAERKARYEAGRNAIKNARGPLPLRERTARNA